MGFLLSIKDALVGSLGLWSPIERLINTLLDKAPEQPPNGWHTHLQRFADPRIRPVGACAGYLGYPFEK
jgi:hypothetical protein